MPLIFGAMSHFIPVLTRSRAAPPGLASIPVLALAGGALVVGALSLPDLFWGRYAGALLAATAASALLAWSRHRRAGMLGRPHPGLAWYDAALACLVSALLAILASAIWPQQTVPCIASIYISTRSALSGADRREHPRGAAAVAGRPGPARPAAARSAVGVAALLVAFGAAWFSPLAWIGGALWASRWCGWGQAG
jgi:hypothetical protein